MRITHAVSAQVKCSPDHAYDFVIAVETPAKVFAGFGPIPAVLRTELLGGGPMRVGAVCRAYNSDGSTMERTITVLDRPARHEYSVDGSGFRPLFRRMVKGGVGRWSFNPSADSTLIRWTYSFEIRSALWWLPAALITRMLFGTAMRRCIDATKTSLEA